MFKVALLAACAGVSAFGPAARQPRGRALQPAELRQPRGRPLQMSDGDGAEPGQQKVVKRKKKQVFEERADESTKAKDQKKDKFEEEGYWRLLLHNDDIHTFEYVTALLQDTVSTISDQKAHEMTITTHEAGVATITQTSKDLAKEYCETLQRAGLTASIAPDKDFEGERKDKPGEGGPSAS